MAEPGKTPWVGFGMMAVLVFVLASLGFAVYDSIVHPPDEIVCIYSNKDDAIHCGPIIEDLWGGDS